MHRFCYTCDTIKDLQGEYGVAIRFTNPFAQSLHTERTEFYLQIADFVLETIRGTCGIGRVYKGVITFLIN